MDDIIGYIYLTTNDINNTLYIGKRQKPFFEKSYKGSGTHLKLAFKKYGKSKFHTSVLEWCETEKDLCGAEKKWIKHYKDSEAELYNIAEGGKGGNVVKWEELPLEKRRQINHKNSVSHIGEKNAFYGKHHSESTKALIKAKSNNGRYPKELMKYKEYQRSILPKIMQIDKKTGTVVTTWDNWCEASRAVSPNNRCGYAHIVECCRHERKSAYGFKWEFAETGWTI